MVVMVVVVVVKDIGMGVGDQLAPGDVFAEGLETHHDGTALANE